MADQQLPSCPSSALFQSAAGVVLPPVDSATRNRTYPAFSSADVRVDVSAAGLKVEDICEITTVTATKPGRAGEYEAVDQNRSWTKGAREQLVKVWTYMITAGLTGQLDPAFQCKQIVLQATAKQGQAQHTIGGKSRGACFCATACVRRTAKLAV